MDDTPPTLAPLRNVAALIGLVDRVINRDLGLPGMATFHGPSGWGKTSAVTIAANEFQAYSVQMKSVWNQTFLCRQILFELGVKPKATIPVMVEQIAAQLVETDRPLIIDDAQYLANKRMIDMIRDIYESCQTTVILVGEQDLPQTLTRWENVHGRMYDWVEAVPCDVADARFLAGVYGHGVTIADDLLEKIVVVAGGSARHVAKNCSRAREIALGKGRDAIDLSLWGKQPFFTGDLPTSANRASVHRLDPAAARRSDAAARRKSA